MINVLLVDDNASIRDALKRLLNEYYRINVVGECSDGCEVIPYLEETENEIDVIVMDISMKIMNGIEATKLVRHQFPFIKIIGYSGNDDSYSMNEILKNGADTFISKYSSIELLINEIEKYSNTNKIAEKSDR